MNPLNIYMIGVGGQGIGLLSDVLARACVSAGYSVRGCDTHGLAQRGGTVSSHLRIGKTLFGPRVPPGKADLVIGLEKLEALRGTRSMLRNGGTVVVYDTEYQPIHVRMKQGDYPKEGELESAVRERKGALRLVHLPDLVDPRMQNVALIGCIASLGVIDGVGVDVFQGAIEQAVPEKVLAQNLSVFEKAFSETK
jgi:indolepyruvate ferredoxin oxidoreductase beta subunit